MKLLAMKKNKKTVYQSDILVSNRKSFVFTEAYKSLRTNVLFSLPKEGCKKIVVTSSIAGEGKSTVSAHLAVAFAEMGSSVLLIDCDLRKGKSHKLFEIKRSPGLANVLAGFSDVNTAVSKTKIENMYVLPCGSVPPNPAELLASPRMQALITELSKSFDYIIFDSSPVNIVSDALSLVNLADGVLIVTRQNFTDQISLTKCIDSLEFVEAKILGVVLNDVESKEVSKYRRYGYYKSGYNISSIQKDK